MGPVPILFDGNISFDDRGSVSFVNDFSFDGVRRFYIVSNHRQGFVRAWHAHRREAKYVAALRGAALIGAVKVDDWTSPDKNAKVHRQVLAAAKPSVFYIPAGYANGFMSLTEDATLAFFSTSTVDESRNDDIRFDARHWDIWSVEER